MSHALRTRRRQTVLAGMLLVLLAGLGPSARAQQAVNSATGVTLFPVGSVVRTHAITRSLSAPGAGRSVNAVLLPVSLNYGATTNLTLAANVPFVRKELDASTPAGPLNQATSGVGDIRLLGKYRFLRLDGYLKTLQLAVLGGVKLPTGATDARLPNGDFLPMPLQVGSGSTDGIAALSGTGIWDWRVAHASLLYRRNAEGTRGYRFGDLINYNLATNFRVWTNPYPGPELYLGAELNGEIRARDERNGADLANTGGHRLFLSPSVVFFAFRNLTLEGSVQVPIYQDLNGTQLEDGVRYVFGFRFQYGLYLGN
ncbi:MAG: hypothetical protein ABEL51_11935 [Salinibacter sp.]